VKQQVVDSNAATLGRRFLFFL